jgi:hypothetical protein
MAAKLEMIQAILNDQSVIFNVYFKGNVTLGMKDPDCEKFLVVNCDFVDKGTKRIGVKRKKAKA